MNLIGKTTTIVFFFILVTTVNAFVLIKLWHWFIVPVFHLPEFRLADAMGFLIVIQFLKTKTINNKDREDSFFTELLTSAVSDILLAVFLMFLGFILQNFV